MDLFFRVSEVARELGANSNTIRRLIEAGLVKGQTTAGGHLRIPASEVERLKRDGIPTAPRPLPPGPEAPDGDAAEIRPVSRAREKPSSVEAAESSPDVVHAAESVRILEHAVSAGELKQRLEEQQDWWKKRTKEEAGERESEEVLRRGQETARERQARRELWQAYALNRIPAAVPAEVRQVVYKNVGDLLDSLNPLPANELITGQLVQAEVQKQLRPWARSTERENAVKAAAERLPAGAKSHTSLTSWQTRAIQAARKAVGQLPDSADRAEIDAAAQHAVDQITTEFAAHQQREEVIGWASLTATILDGGKTAKKAIIEALSSLPLTASRSDLQAAADEALAPYRKAVAQRQAEQQDRAARQSLITIATIKLSSVPPKETEKAIAAVVKALAELPAGTPQARLEEACDRTLRPYIRRPELIRTALSEVYPWLMKHEGELDLEGKSLVTVEGELKGDLEKVLAEQLGGIASPEQAAKFARRWLREEFRL